MTDNDRLKDNDEPEENCPACRQELSYGECINTSCEESPDYYDDDEEEDDDEDEDEGKTKEEVF